MKKTLAAALALFVLALPAAANAAGPELYPPSLSFGPTTVGEESSSLEVQLSNQAEAMTIDAVTVDGDGSFRLEGHSCGVQQAGWPCSLWVAFAPTGAGAKEATATITFKDELRDPLTVPLSGTGAAPELRIEPPSHDFGLLMAGRENRNHSFKVVNDGAAPIRLDQLEIGGSGAFVFGNDQCSKRLLQPGDSCDQEVWFSPQEMGEYEAVLRVPAAGTSFEAELSGTGGRALVGADPVEFGASPVGSAGPVRTITLTNSGNLAGAFFIAVISSGDVGSFRLLSESCTMIELAPDSSCTARVRFDPQEAGPLGARLMMFGDGEPTMVALGGEGISAPGASGFSASEGAEPAPRRKVRHKRFGRGKGIPYARAKAQRRAPLHAAAAR